jgi:hypothetical protein
MSDHDDPAQVTARIIAESGGDPARGRQIRRALERLRDSPDPRLRELATEILAGRRDVRSVVRDTAFNEALTTRITRFWSEYHDLGDEERAALLRTGQAQRERDLRGD